MREWLCGTLSKPWGLAEVRRIEEQAEGGRIYKDAVRNEVLDPDFLMMELLLSADQEKHRASVSGNRLVAVLDGTLPGSSGLPVPL